eukprot:12838364-Alexandrium_andersonii.AAC.1
MGAGGLTAGGVHPRMDRHAVWPREATRRGERLRRESGREDGHRMAWSQRSDRRFDHSYRARIAP